MVSSALLNEKAFLFSFIFVLYSVKHVVFYTIKQDLIHKGCALVEKPGNEIKGSLGFLFLFLFVCFSHF